VALSVILRRFSFKWNGPTSGPALKSASLMLLAQGGMPLTVSLRET